MAAVADAVKNLCTLAYPGGLATMGFHLRDQAPHVPYAVMLDCPIQPLHGNANEWSAFNYNAKKYQHVATTLIILRNQVLAAIGPDIVERLKHPVTGMLDVQLVDIFQYMHKHYGQLTAKDINELQVELSIPLKCADDFNKVASRHMQIYAILQATNANVGDHQKMNKVAEISVSCPLVMQACTQYQIQVEPMLRSFQGLVDYVVSALENNSFSTLPVQALGYSGTTMQSMDIDALLALVTAAATKAKSNTSVQLEQKSKGNAEKYCWVHGYSGHAGDMCTIMTNPNNSFASECVKAKGPNDIVGKTGSVKNKK